MFENLQGDTVKTMSVWSLPSGCSELVKSGEIQFTCLGRMTHVVFKVERRWMPKEQEYEDVARMIGFCKRHRPKGVTAEMVSVELTEAMVRKVNGPKSKRARMRRLEEAMFVRAVPTGGTKIHRVSKENAKMDFKKGRAENVVTACEKTIRRVTLPSLAEITRKGYTDCSLCLLGMKVVGDVAIESAE
jgi:hypothetical protein